jgi:glutaredoxin
VEHLLFTLPGCLKCDALKKALAARGVAWQEFNLVHKDAKTKLRDFREAVKRDESGAVILPTLILSEGGTALAVVHSAEEYETWSRSRA